MARWADFHPDLRVHVPGCPEPLLDQELARAAALFFRRSKLWTAWLEPIATAGSLTTYDLEVPEDAEVVALRKATLNGQVLPLGSYRLVSNNPERGRAGERALISADPQAVTLLHQVPSRSVLEVEAVLTVAEGAGGIPDALANAYREAIVAGARYRLHRIPGPLYQPEAAKAAGAEFEQALASDQASGWLGRVGQVPRTRVAWC